MAVAEMTKLHKQSLLVFDVDGTFETAGGPVKLSSLAKLTNWGILSSRSRERAKEATLRLEPLFIEVCRVDMRKEELLQIKNNYPNFGRYIYVADREIDRSEALAAGWEFYFAHNFGKLLQEERNEGS